MRKKRPYAFLLTLTELSFVLIFIFIFFFDRENEDLRHVVDEYKNVENFLRSEITINNDEPFDFFSEYQKIVNENKGLKEQLSAVTGSVAECAEFNSDLTGQVNNLLARVNSGGGRDLPPCWADFATGKVQYLYDIVLYDEHIFVSPAWPPERNISVEQFPLISEIANKEYSINDFLQKAAPIYEKSIDKTCRHYVKVYDRTTSKKGLSAIFDLENYFYKFLSNK